MAVNPVGNRSERIEIDSAEPISEGGSSGPLVGITSGPNQETVLISTTVGTGAADIPTPGSESISLERRQQQLQQLIALRDQLRPLATGGDQAAQQLLSEIEQIIPRLEQQLSQDMDSDGLPDGFDPDSDGDNILDAREIEDGTNPLSLDTDGDGISDDNEIRLRNLGLQLGDPGLVQMGNGRSADANHDGIIDSAQLRSEVRSTLGLAATASDGGVPGTVGTQAMGGNGGAQWGGPTGNYQTMTLTPNGQTSSVAGGGGTYVIQAPEEGGEIRVSRQDSTLRIDFENGSGTGRLLIPDFEQKKLYFFGEANLQFVNFDPQGLVTTNSYGYAETGIYIASGTDSWASGAMDVSSVINPFNRDDLPEEEDRVREGVRTIEYDVSDQSDLTFNLLDQFEGEELKQWTAVQDGQSLVLEGKNRSGETKIKFVLRGGMDILEELKIQLSDIGQRLDSQVSVEISGGSGDDLVYTVGGDQSRVYLGAGDDTAAVTDDNRVEFYGQGGDDILRGAAGDDRLVAGEGNDYIYGGTGENRLYGDAGNDTLWTANTTIGSGTQEVVDGGGGMDVTNAYNGATMSIEAGIEDLNGLQSYLTQYGGEGASAVELTEIVNMEQDDLPYIRQLISEQLHQLAMNYVLLRDAERQAWFTESPGSGTFNQWQTNGTPGAPTGPFPPNGSSNDSEDSGNSGPTGGWQNGYMPL
ncbi:MAG: hypothetical protein HYW02_01455 [Deltaproteobacteria bacterium]|nr:hypothetical protein [Deltaproteobacteria bacterium]